MTHLYYKHERNIRAKSGALCWKLWSDYMTEIVSATMRQIDRRRHCVNNFELHPLKNIHM